MMDLKPFSMDDKEKSLRAVDAFDKMSHFLTSDTHEQILFLVTLLANVMTKHVKDDTTDAQLRQQCKNLGEMIGDFMIRNRNQKP